jgi:elongation factor P--beta-lysine ligase
MDIAVNWHVLSRAMGFYQDRGYRVVDVPWLVPSTTCYATLPGFASKNAVIQTKSGHGSLVGSAEQSFLQLQLDDHPSVRSPGLYVACSPCFRNEPVLDDLHHKHFMKVELYATLRDHEAACERLIADAYDFFCGYIFKKYITRVETNDGFDLEIGGIEIGSYGVRHYQNDTHDLTWVCGTGVAEPRFTTALSRSSCLFDERWVD